MHPTLILTQRKARPERAGNVRAVTLHYEGRPPVVALAFGHHYRHAAAAAKSRLLVDPRGILPPYQMTRREAALARLLARKQTKD